MTGSGKSAFVEGEGRDVLKQIRDISLQRLSRGKDGTIARCGYTRFSFHLWLSEGGGPPATMIRTRPIDVEVCC